MPVSSQKGETAEGEGAGTSAAAAKRLGSREVLGYGSLKSKEGMCCSVKILRQGSLTMSAVGGTSGSESSVLSMEERGEEEGEEAMVCVDG